MIYSEEYRVKKVVHPHAITVEVPGSKSITNRALLIAALANGKSVLRGVLFSDDSRHFLQALVDLGFEVSVDQATHTVEIVGCGGRIPRSEATVNVGSAGTAARFLTALLGLSDGQYRMDASEQMKKRPMKELLTALESLGAQITYEEEEYHFPYTIGNHMNAKLCKNMSSLEVSEEVASTKAKVWYDSGANLASNSGNMSLDASTRSMNLNAGNDSMSLDVDTRSRKASFEESGLQENQECAEITIDVDKSSQFLSALLITSVLFPHGITIHVTGSHGMAYVRMTVEMMRQFGLSVDVSADERTYQISEGASYEPRDYIIEPDLSAACYFYAAGAILGVTAKVLHVHEKCMQGDIAFLSVLCDMGCSMREEADGILLLPVEGGGVLHGGSWNLASFSDQALTLAAIAPFTDSAVEIHGISHIRYQECDRIRAILENLHAMGVRCEELEDGVRIYPAAQKPNKDIISGVPEADGPEAGRVEIELQEIKKNEVEQNGAGQEDIGQDGTGQEESRQLHGAGIETFEDHRVAMAFAIPGLRLDGQVIINPSCCRKTFENFFEVLEACFS